MQQEHDSSTDVCTQSIDQDSQERPVDVEEVEVEHEKKMHNVEEVSIDREEDQLPANSTQTIEPKVVEALDAKEVEGAATHEEINAPAAVEEIDCTESRLSEETLPISQTSNFGSHVDEPVSLQDEELVAESSETTTFVEGKII